MQYVQQKSPLLDMGQDETVKHLMHTISRSLIVMLGGTLYIWVMLSTVAWTRKLLPANGWGAIVIIVVYVPVIRLLEKRPRLAQILWEIGLAVAITLALYISKEPIVGFFYTFIPLITIVTLGWSACLVAEGLLIVWICVLSVTDALLPLSSIYALGIIFTGAATGLMGWAITHTLLTVTAWSLHSYNQSRLKMEEAREHRAELLQVQEDLLQANQELARMSDRMRALHQIAEGASQAKAEFVANVSHELRTPLNMIIGFSEVITEAPEIYGDLPSALIADITAIQRNSEHLAKLVNDVLDLSQVDAGRMALSRTWSSMTEILNAAIEVVRDLYESKGLYLTIDTSSDLPNVFCDTTRVRQVVINLLSNAGRFTERGGVTIKAWQEKHGITISVADTGPGIAEEDQAKLFEPFQQLDSSIRRRYGGSGLGLSISKRFVEMHGGKMWLESKLGAGTMIAFTLPLGIPHSDVHEHNVRESALRWFNPYQPYEARARPFKAPSPTIVPRYVVLEKGETLQRLFLRYMDDVEVVPVQSIEKALAMLHRSPAQALVVNTPPVGELALSRDMLSDVPFSTPIVTCWVPGEVQFEQTLGVMRYLIKPVTRDDLLKTLESLNNPLQPTPRQVLVVDDERDLLRLFIRMLSSAGDTYQVLWATNGPQALSLMRERQPDVILLDLIMPEMDGFQVLQEKSHDPTIQHIPVVVVTSLDPQGEPIMSDALTVSRGTGLSARDLLACIELLSQTLSPSVHPVLKGRSDD